MSRPDVEAVLKPLKPFQRRTVDHAFHRLFEASDATNRFLVADEVGLGKTLVARGIIARAIDHLWDTVERIDVVYICSNSSIARANLPKLHVGGGERSLALATRLTMLATELAPREGRAWLGDSKVNFVSFTPGTSFEMGHSTGQSDERVVLFRLLEPLLDSSRTGLMNLLQAGIQNVQAWRWRLDYADFPLDPDIERRFAAGFRSDRALREELQELLETWFGRYREVWPDEVRRHRNQVVGRLRQILAEACVQALEPDLVILDEFQRFKGLLETREDQRDPAAELAQALFHAETPEGHPVRTLLLSATPYKLYTADAEIEHEDHYADFLATTRFLLAEDEGRVTALKGSLSRFGGALKKAAAGHPEHVAAAKAEVEVALRAVMARTERIAASEDRDAMVEEPKHQAQLAAPDVRQYVATDAMFKAVGAGDPMVFWKSAPHLSHFMRDYAFNRRLEETIAHSPERVARVLDEHPEAFLTIDQMRTWDGIDPANGKLRELTEDLIDGGLWRLLWMPPTVPYWPSTGAFEGQEGRSKALLFSSWNVVPDVVSALLSYEAERRMMGGRLSSYVDPAKQQVPLLRLTQTATGVRSRHRLFLLLLPCLPLADGAHPLTAPLGTDRRAWVRSKVESLLADPRLPDPHGGEVDDRWEWAAPLLLDPGLGASLRAWLADGSINRPNPELFTDYVGDLLALRPETLGRRPPGLVELMTEIALGSPAVLAARMMASAGIPDATRRLLAVRLADSFWRMFNRPAVISLLLQLAAAAPDPNRDENVYWRLVCRYCQDGNLQAVLDETRHLAWEQHSWSADQPAVTTASQCLEQLVLVVQPTPSRVQAQFLTVEEDTGAIVTEHGRFRTDFALRFGDIRTEERSVSQDTVRAEFNSPFRPFVLASTSVGQEGLDFHPWCHRLVHWNLPGNPVDLEQREGRVHRYKGHAVRKNVAKAHSNEALSTWRPGDNLWSVLFAHAERAARARGDSDLVPHWIAPGPHRVQRHVPMLPYTKEVEAFRRLKRQLAAYRVVFGQPRQEELVTLLDQAQLDLSKLREWAVDLAPPVGSPSPSGSTSSTATAPSASDTGRRVIS